jgi:hypothetical protein
MTADKRLLFEFPVPESKVSLPADESESSQVSIFYLVVFVSLSCVFSVAHSKFAIH